MCDVGTTSLHLLPGAKMYVIVGRGLEVHNPLSQGRRSEV